MVITLTSTGGFAGPAAPETRVVDVAAMPAGAGARIRALVVAADLGALPAEIRKPHPQSWDFLRKLTVEGDGPPRTVRFHDDAAPSALRALADAVASARRG